MYPGVRTFVLIRPTQTFYERIKVVYLAHRHRHPFSHYTTIGLYRDYDCTALAILAEGERVGITRISEPFMVLGAVEMSKEGMMDAR